MTNGWPNAVAIAAFTEFFMLSLELQRDRSVHRYRRSSHPIEFVEIAPGSREQLTFRQALRRLIPHDLPACGGTVLLDVVAKIGERLVRTEDQNLGDAGNGIADLTEELMLRTDFARVLARIVMVRSEMLSANLFCLHFQHLCRFVIQPHDRMK